LSGRRIGASVIGASVIGASVKRRPGMFVIRTIRVIMILGITR
jgi:hypothetical protein